MQIVNFRIMKKLLSILCLLAIFLDSCNKNQEKHSIDDNPSMIVASELSNQRINAFAEDSLGRIWVGTFRGLNRFNSIDYHQYFCTDSCIDLPDNQIISLLNDSRNRLWVGTINGISIYDNNDHFRPIPNNNPATSYNPIQILESRDKRILVNHGTHLDVYDEDKGEFITAIPSLSENFITNLQCYFDRRNKLWVIDSKSIRCFRPDTYQQIFSTPLPARVQTNYMDTDNDRLWLGGDGYLGIFDLRNKKMVALPETLEKHPSVSDANITQIHRYEEGYWLFNTSNKGLIVYNSNADRVWKEADPGFPFNLPDFKIERFFTDSNKNLWVGSYDQGIAIINNYRREFNSNIALHNFISRRSINSIDNDKNGNIWMATLFNGLEVFNILTGDAVSVELSGISDGNRTPPAITLVKVSRDGHLWLASLLKSKVWRCSWSNGKLNVEKEYNVPTPISILEDSRGALWVGSGQKWLLRYNNTTDVFDAVEIGHGPDNLCFVSGLADAGDKIYVGAYMRPLMQAKFENNKIVVDTVNITGWDKMISRGAFMPSDMLLDSFGELWIGTVGNGLIRYNPETKHLSHISLPCTDIAAIEEYKTGNIWVSTQYGLSRIMRNSGRIKTYYASDGIGGNQFYDRSSMILPNGHIMFGGTHGLTSFNPIEIGIKRKVPLVLEDLEVHNSHIDPLKNPEIIEKELGNAKKINLGVGQNNFSISFAALDYASFVKPRYSFMLENHDPYWIEGRNSNAVSYSNLPSGDYILHVRILDDSDTVIGEEISIPIHVKGNPWTSWWAWTIYILAILAIIYYVLIHVQGLHLKFKLEKATAKEPETCETEPATLSASDQKFLHELQDLMETEIANPDIDVNRITKMMRISRTKLYYKVKSLTGQNPSAYFKNYKLEHAAILLKEGKHTVWEIAEMTGFSTTAHFSTSFKKKFGKTPTEFSK